MNKQITNKNEMRNVLYQIKIDMGTDLNKALKKRPTSHNCHLSNRDFTLMTGPCGGKVHGKCLCMCLSIWLTLAYQIENLITHQYWSCSLLIILTNQIMNCEFVVLIHTCTPGSCACRMSGTQLVKLFLLPKF